jgi:hypothetical protein
MLGPAGVLSALAPIRVGSVEVGFKHRSRLLVRHLALDQYLQQLTEIELIQSPALEAAL